MAFTTSDDHKLTATDVITEALEIIGVLAEGEAPSTDASTSALRSLNNLIKLWSVDSQIYAQNEYTLDLVASTGTYTLDSTNVGYIPNKIINVTRVNSSTGDEVPINRLTQEEWYALADKTTTGTVVQYYQKRNPVGVAMDLHVWPVPANTTWDLKLWLQYPLRDVDAGTDDVYFTQEWYLALSFKLAHILSFKYGLSLQEKAQIRDEADDFYEIASSYDVDGSVFVQPRAKHG